jgi:hypothetical protein
VSVSALLAVFGTPLAALPRIGAAPYLMKMSFGAAVAVFGWMALRRAGTPGRPLAVPLALLAAPFAAVMALAMVELVVSDPAWPGGTWLRCLSTIASLTPTAFALAIVGARRRAPTRLRLAGGLAGVFAGAVAASLYALWCPETNAVFLLVWYGAPIAGAGLIGSALGPRLLRW